MENLACTYNFHGVAEFLRTTAPSEPGKFNGFFAGLNTGLAGEAVPVDQHGEQTTNRHAKENAGIWSIRNDNILQQWAAITPIIAKIYESRCGKEAKSHHTLHTNENVTAEKTHPTATM